MKRSELRKIIKEELERSTTRNTILKLNPNTTITKETPYIKITQINPDDKVIDSVVIGYKEVDELIKFLHPEFKEFLWHKESPTFPVNTSFKGIDWSEEGGM